MCSFVVSGDLPMYGMPWDLGICSSFLRRPCLLKKVMNPELKAALDVIDDQKAQLRLIVDAYSSQINWAKQWRGMCHENMRLQILLKAKDDGTEVLDLRRQLIDKTVELAQAQAGFHQRGVLLRGALNEVRLLTAENERLLAAQQQP